MHPFPIPWKHQKTERFYVFGGVEKRCIGNEWVNPLLANALILYLLKTPNENLWFSGVFRGHKMEITDRNGWTNSIFFTINFERVYDQPNICSKSTLMEIVRLSLLLALNSSLSNANKASFVKIKQNFVCV